MKKGIAHFYGFDIDKEERAKLIHEQGFDCVITNQDSRFFNQNGTMQEQMDIFKKYNLEVSSLHNQYVTEELPNFWLDNEIGTKLENTLKYDIETAGKYGIKCVVVHMMGEYSAFGETRLKRILDFCETHKVFLAVENIDYKHPFIEIFEKINHPYLKFCYDSGHNNCFDPEIDYLEKYGDKLICLHLHDNNGKQDEHTLNRFGTINWHSIAKKLAKLDTSNLVLDYETLMYGHRNEVELSECLSEIYRQPEELENLIKKYKNN